MPSHELIAELAFRRQLAALSGERRRRSKRTPPQKFPKRVQITYSAALRKYQETVNGLIRELIFPQLETLVPPRLDGLRMDVDEDELDRLINGIRFRLEDEVDIEPDIEKSAQDTSEWQKAELSAQVRAVVGVDITTAEPWLAEHLEQHLRSNVGLIKKMTETQLLEMETIIRSGRRQGLRVETIRSQIIDRMEVTKSRAYLIARDQVNKLNGELNKRRQEDLGVDEYIWRDSDDERVRPSHQELDGTTQRWDDPPDEGHPGEPVQCRCFAEPVLTHLLED